MKSLDNRLCCFYKACVNRLCSSFFQICELLCCLFLFSGTTLYCVLVVLFLYVVAQDITVEIRRRNELYVEHVHHYHRHASYKFSRMNRSWINATSFYVSIQEELSNYLGYHMTVAWQSCLHSWLDVDFISLRPCYLHVFQLHVVLLFHLTCFVICLCMFVIE